MIEYRDVTVRFDDVTALPGFSLRIEQGEFFTLLGPSGCGKSTALRTLAGLIEPTGGAVLVDGVDVTRMPSHRRQLGMVFQNYALFPSMTAGENIAFGLRTAKVGKDETAQRVARIADEVGLTTAQLDRGVAELSGGQQQRVAIARSLVLRPKILLLDEPLSNLDAKMRQQLRGQLKELQEQVGITTLYVTHDQDEALAMSDRLAVMNAGRIEQVGTPEEVYAESATPFVTTFVGEVNELGPRARATLGLAGRVDDGPAYVRTEHLTITAARGAAGAAGAAAGAGHDGWVVVKRRFHGLYHTYLVRSGDEQLTVIAHGAASDLTPGTPADLSIDPADVRQFAEVPA